MAQGELLPLWKPHIRVPKRLVSSPEIRRTYIRKKRTKKVISIWLNTVLQTWKKINKTQGSNRIWSIYLLRQTNKQTNKQTLMNIWTADVLPIIMFFLRGSVNKFPDFFVQALKIVVVLKIHYVIAIRLMRWQTDFYDFRFKGTATATIGIYPTNSWLSQLVYFKKTIWTWRHFTRTMCNKILF